MQGPNSIVPSNAERIQGVLNTCMLLMVLKAPQIVGFGATIVRIMPAINPTLNSVLELRDPLAVLLVPIDVVRGSHKNLNSVESAIATQTVPNTSTVALITPITVCRTRSTPVMGCVKRWRHCQCPEGATAGVSTQISTAIPGAQTFPCSV